MMQQQEKKKIKNHLPFLMENVNDIEGILDCLFANEIFTICDRELVNAEITTKGKVRKLVDKLLFKDSTAIPGFIQALRETKQCYIVEELEKTVSYQPNQIDDDLKVFISNVLIEKFEATDTKSKVSLQEIWDALRDTARSHGRLFEFDDVDDGNIVDITKTVFTSCKVEHPSPRGKNKRSNIHFVGIWTKHDENAYSDDAMGEMSSNDQDTGATGDSKNTSIGSQTYCEENRIKPLCEMNVAEICKWLTDVKECTKLNFDVDSFLTNEIDGEAFVSLTIDELKELIPALGTRKKLIMERDKIESSVIPRSTYLYDIKKTPTDIKLSEILRKFDNEVGVTDKYRKGSVINIEQSRVKNLIDPVHRFILPKNAEEEEILNCFLTETVKFGAACMNERTNGTIHFGIVGSTENEDNYNAGKIVGIHVNKISFQKRLTEAIQQYFFPDQQSKALSCIRPAKFIEVTTSVGKSDILHVIEVDVVPSFRIINGESFFLKVLDGNEKDSCRFYRYSENGPALQNHKNIAEYMKECHTLSENRKDAEDRLLKVGQPINLFKKLSDFLCCGCDRIESDIYPLLFINSPDTNMGMQTELEPFAFLKDIPFRAIFDFAQNREKSIMYKYLNEDLKQVFLTKFVEEFDIDRVDKKQMKETFDGLKESSVPSWVFCSSDMVDENHDVMSWKLNYSKSFREILKFYYESIPKDRARVLFLLLSKDYEIMQEAAIEVLIEFQDQCIFVAENELCASQWKDSLLKGHCIDKRKLEDCSLIGLPWVQVNKAIQKMSDSSNKEDVEIPRSNGVPCNLPERMKKELSDLDILGSNVCKLQDESLTEKEREDLQQEFSEKFYSGEQAAWLNFYYPDQVLPREKSGELRRMISTSLISEIKDPEECVRSVAIYHQPGAGGTTLGKYMLWEFRNDYRCCIIQKITSQTGDQLFRLFEYQDENRPKPLLILIDNGDDDYIFPLYEDLQKRKRSETEIFCILLVCYRKTEMPVNKIERNIFLAQKLSEPEVQWFKRKYQYLQDKFKEQGGCNPKQLLSFNIMKENYNKECIENSVSEFVRDIYDRGNEGMLIKFIAFANTFDLNFQAIPAACFDPIMSKQSRNGWECKLSQAARVLLSRNFNRGVGGKIASFRVSSSLLSRYILNAVLDIEKDISGKKKTIGEVSFEFLHSPLFKDSYLHSHQQDILLRILLNIVYKRAWNDTKRRQFSPLVVELISEGDTNSALDVLQTAYEITDNPIVAQQIARFYEYLKIWEKADNYITEAIEKSDRTKINSYLWHTKGQIFHSRLLAMKEQHKQQKQLTLSDIEKVISFSRKAIFIFRKVQELSCNEDSSTQNLAGYDSEIQVTLDLLNILGNSHFSGHEELRKFLLEGQGDQLSFLDTTDTEFLRCLQTSVYETLETLERSIHFVEEKQFLDQSKRLAILNRGQLERYKAKLLSWFAIPLPSGDLSKNEKFVYNRMLAREKGATSLFSLLKLRDNIERLNEIYKTINKNVQEGSTNPEDYWIFIATILALPDKFKEKGMVAKAVELSRNHFDNIDKLKNSGQKLESCFYLVLLNWPSPNNYLPNMCPLSVLKKAIIVWSDVSSSLPAEKRRRDKILFYLGNGNDNNLFIYDECLKKNPSPRSSKPNIYRTNFALNQLARLEGLLKNNGEVVEVKLCKPGDKVGSTIQIPVLCPIKRHTAWNRNVYFILGFGLKGLKAIDLTEELPSSVYEKDSAEQERVKGLIRNSPYPTMQDSQNISIDRNVGQPRTPYQNQIPLQPRMPYLPVLGHNQHSFQTTSYQSPHQTQALYQRTQQTFSQRNTRYPMQQMQNYQFRNDYNRNNQPK